MTTTDIKPRYYSYDSYRDRYHRPAWFDMQTHRWISRHTLASRTGLPLEHIYAYEDGRDGYGYRTNRAERDAAEAAMNVALI